MQENASGIVGAGLSECRKRAEDYARRDLPVLIVGDTGTGKELLAAAYINAWCFNRPATRTRHATLNCSGVADDILASELFGSLRGAFTGATNRDGLIQGHDLICLDELGDSSDRFQAQLLRLVETGDYRKVGASVFEHWQGRSIASTNRPERIRQDLAFRFHRITVPRLAERREDIPALVSAFGHKHQINQVTCQFVRWAAIYDWPGNVRELLRCIEEGSITGRLDIPNGALSAMAKSLSATPYVHLHQSIAAADGTVPLVSFEKLFHASLDSKAAAFLIAQERFDRHRREESDIARLTRQVETLVSRYQPPRQHSPIDLLGVASPASPADEHFIRALEETGSVKAYAQKTGEPYNHVLRTVRELEERTGKKRGKDFLVTRKRRDH